MPANSLVKRDLYAEVTAQIVSDMEQGVLPWAQPWKAHPSVTQSFTLPFNAATKRPYRGINIMLLWAASRRNDYSTMQYLTYKQAKALGGTVRKGEHGHRIYFFKPLVVTERKD